MRAVVVALLAVSQCACAKAEIIQLTCGKTGLTIDTEKPSVVVHFNNGFSQTYENATTSSSYQFLDGSRTPYTSTVVVTINDKEIAFSNQYRSDAGLNAIGNAIDRKTGLWRSSQNGRMTETHCVK